MLLFHIAKSKEWQQSLKTGFYSNPSIKKDGFIHCSEFNQLLHIANSNLKNINEELVVLCIDSDKLKPEIKWETNKNNGMTFPHVYGLINVDSVIDTADFKKNQLGDFYIPDKLLNFAHFEKSCGAILFHKFDKEYKVLLIGFTYNNIMRWGFPKGHIENNETEIQTAIREVKEEVNLDIKILPKFREETNFIIKPYNMRKVVYYCAESKFTKAIPQEGEVEKIEWLNFEDAHKRLSYDCDKNIINKSIKFFKEYKKDL